MFESLLTEDTETWLGLESVNNSCVKCETVKRDERLEPRERQVRRGGINH